MNLCKCFSDVSGSGWGAGEDAWARGLRAVKPFKAIADWGAIAAISRNTRVCEGSLDLTGFPANFLLFSSLKFPRF